MGQKGTQGDQRRELRKVLRDCLTVVHLSSRYRMDLTRGQVVRADHSQSTGIPSKRLINGNSKASNQQPIG